MMTRVARLIVRHRVSVLVIAALLLGAGVFGMLNTRINYDLLAYLPDDLESVQGFRFLTEDFSLGNTAQVMVVGASEGRVAGLADQVAGIEGVADVAWVDDLGDLSVPREFWEHAAADSYVAGDSTFFQVSFSESANDPLTRSAVYEIRDVMAQEEAYIAGVEQLELEDTINADRTRFAVAAVALVSIALLLTIPSVIVPLLFVVTIGLAVVYNLGMSYFIGQEISYLTGVIVLALQFAVTMDYALFLYHRYEQERAHADNETAMVTALAATFRSVAAAALTTTAGFLALMTMRLGFGADMGGTLARGVIITLIATLTVLPALLLVFDGAIRRFAHRTYMPDFSRLGGWLARHAVSVTVLLVLLFVPAFWS
ncbi:MAG TPA: MMPL family transporter, partial [Coriobacteriia bacterium]|nr:MMPL family transporter [Coriobacteriia bacterium]